jgi:hypothetical protein
VPTLTAPPRVPAPIPHQSPRHQSPVFIPQIPAIPTPEPPTHPYPTQNLISQTQDEVKAVHQLLDPNHDIRHWINAIINPTTGASMEYRHLSKSPKHQNKWIHSFANELGRLAQGIGGRETSTNTVFFIPHDQVPKDCRKDVTYGSICVDYRPHRTEPNRTCLTVGGNLTDFPGDATQALLQPIRQRQSSSSTVPYPYKGHATCVQI